MLLSQVFVVVTLADRPDMFDILAWEDRRVVMFETATFSLRTPKYVALPVAIFIKPATFEFVTFDPPEIILSAKVTSPGWATNELITLRLPSTVNLPRFVFEVPTATFASR